MAASNHNASEIKALVDNLPGIVFRVTVEPDGTLHLDFICKEARSILGIDPAAVQQDPARLFDLVPPEEREEVEALVRKSRAAGSRIDREIRIFHKNGERRWLRIEATPRSRPDAEGDEWFGIAMDVTGSRERERELDETRSLLKGILDSVEDAVFVVGPPQRHVVVSANPAFARMLGYASPEDLIAGITDIATQYYENPEDRRRYQKILYEKGYVENFEAKVLRKDGTSIWVSHSTRAHFDESGKIVRLEGIVDNIDERKQAEKEKERLQAQLTQAQKMESIGTLAGGIAHDFNNILSAIIGYTQLAQEDAAQIPDVHRYLQEVMLASKRARNLVAQILAFSRQTDTEIAPVQVHLIVKEVVKMLQATLPSFIEIREKIESFGMAMADPAQIHQVILNLCTNAYHAMKDEGGILTVALSEGEMAPETAVRHPDLPPARYLILTVADTGVGMDRKTIKRIFDPYFTTKEPGEGTGLGLAVAFGVVRAMGGVIEVESALGRGATFTVYLPEIERPASLEEIAEAAPAMGGGERILFVDDEPPLVQMTVRILQRLGYRVEARTSSTEALERFKAAPEDFDLVITDMMMPHMTGEKLAREMQAVRPKMPIILCTGYSDWMDQEKASAMGIGALLMKPIVKSEMAQVIREVLDEPDKSGEAS